jgi:Flp pilus assembly protein TadG
MLVLGMVEIGRAVMVQQVLTNASREGARRAVLDGATAAEVRTFVTNYLTNASVAGTTVTFPQGNPEAAGYGAPVEVRVSVPFGQVSWVPAPMYLSGQTLSASTIMRRETVQ